MDLTADTERRKVFVDVWAVDDALRDWLDANPGVSEEEGKRKVEELMVDPCFHVSLEDMQDDEERYSMIEVDQTGRLIRQDD